VREIRTETRIEAEPERVWQVLTDFASYPDWNPFMRRISGEPTVGSRLEVRIEPPDSRGMTFKPTVIRSEANRELAWLGRLGVRRVFDGEHHLELHPVDGDSTLFVQREEFRGVLIPFFGGALEKTRRGFEAMNAALKLRAEGGSA
jgi:hypothetical protein